MSTDDAGNVLLGGRASQLSDLGDGALGSSVPFIAKYTPNGALVWKRLFSHASAGEVVSLQAMSTGDVAFIAELGGHFRFNGSDFFGGSIDSDPTYPENVSAFVGGLSATGTDEWIRDLRPARVQQLVVGGDDAITVTGHGDVYDLGGGPLGINNPAGPTAFVVQYSAQGEHRWTRLFDRNFEGGTGYYPVLQLAPQPGGSVLAGTDFSTPVLFDGTTYTPRGSADLFYFQLAP